MTTFHFEPAKLFWFTIAIVGWGYLFARGLWRKEFRIRGYWGWWKKSSNPLGYWEYIALCVVELGGCLYVLFLVTK